MSAVAIPIETTRAGQAPRLSPREVVPTVTLPWLRAQALNSRRHAAALRPFRREEFGTGSEAPSEGHIQAVNNLMNTLRGGLMSMTKSMHEAAEAATSAPSTSQIQNMLNHKERAHNWVRGVERIWDFYFELFGQRQSRPFGLWLVGCDRIALDCYQDAFMFLGTAKSIPAPPPFSYMRTGFSPSTYRRGIPLTRLGRQLNPFPLVQLPYHRLINPWTLGAILHEVSHNLQNDLGLNRAIPRSVALHLLKAGFPRSVAMTWTRWNRESFADLSGLLLGGPAIIASLLDVLGRSPATAVSFVPRAPHPTPYIRAFLSFELARRMGFEDDAKQYMSLWRRMYPIPASGTIPRPVLDTFPDAVRVVVNAMCFHKYKELGNKTYAEVTGFGPKEQQIVEEASRRLAAGNDPGIVPERFLIGAARLALDRRLARPGVIAKNFFQELARR